MFIWLQLNVSNLEDGDTTVAEDTNDTAAIFSMIPKDFHKYLKPKLKTTNDTNEAVKSVPNISEIKASIDKYNEVQYVYNEDIFGPVYNDSLIIVVQV